MTRSSPGIQEKLETGFSKVYTGNEGLEAEEFLMDCGVEIYDNQKQDTHAGVKRLWRAAPSP